MNIIMARERERVKRSDEKRRKREGERRGEEKKENRMGCIRTA